MGELKVVRISDDRLLYPFDGAPTIGPFEDAPLQGRPPQARVKSSLETTCVSPNDGRLMRAWRDGSPTANRYWHRCGRHRHLATRNDI
ncbi:DUF6723 family protein [Paraburkholderia strydomiana]|uniref:DUF6723 family protein n=1 Tax=Paraburkholderia strydomiana TaxID=1245417 RepID=UPI003EBBF1C9